MATVFPHPPTDDLAILTAQLGRVPEADFEICVRTPAGEPAVIRNAPLMSDGTPMPTRYWLVDPKIRVAVSRLESAGGVRAAEAAVNPEELAAAHSAYAAERDSALPPGHSGHRPSGGVGGAARGVKCLHAHYAYFLAGGDDPVGRWVGEKLAAGNDPVGRWVGEKLAAGNDPVGRWVEERLAAGNDPVGRWVEEQLG